MFGKILSLFILTSFLFSFLAEVEGVHNFSKSNEQQLVSGYSSVYVSTIVGNDCEDCQDCDCGDHTSHCSHHCSGIHNIAPAKNHVSINNPVNLNDKALWYYNHHYNTPYLDPALKPPMFS